MKNNKAEAPKVEATQSNQSYQKPELKKHGKLKSTATQSTTVYTYTYIT